MCSPIHWVGCWVDVPHSMQLLTCNLSNLGRRSVLRNSVEISVNQRIWVSLSTDACEPTMEEPCMLKHLPNGWISPIIWYGLWENLNLKIIMSSLQESWWSKHLLHIEAHQILPSFFKSVIEGLLVLLSFSFSIGHQPISISNKNQNSSRVDSVERCDICYGIRCHENQSEMVWIENLVSFWLEISLSVGTMVLVSLRHRGLRHIEWAKLVLLTRSSSFLLVDFHQVMVVVQVFTATKLLHHDHLILPHLRCDFQ